MARILIVDDSITYRQLMKEAIEGGGHTVVGEGKDGVQGIELYKELKPDITTMDITMPNLDGLAALKFIMEYDPSATVIMVSSTAQSKKLAEAASLGAVDFLVKPFESEKVLDIIDRLEAAFSEDNADAELDLDELDFLNLDDF